VRAVIAIVNYDGRHVPAVLFAAVMSTGFIASQRLGLSYSAEWKALRGRNRRRAVAARGSREVSLLDGRLVAEYSSGKQALD